MAVSYQLVIDCASPDTLAHFWAEALHYVIAPPPPGFDSWDAFFRSIGVPEDELGNGADIIEDPKGEGPRIWFQIVPEKKSIKNRLHIDVNASGGRGSSLDTRRERVEAEAARLVTIGATRLHTIFEEGLDHCAVALADPEGNEFDIPAAPEPHGRRGGRGSWRPCPQAPAGRTVWDRARPGPRWPQIAHNRGQL